MTMFNITDGNISRDKPVEHIDLVIGLHVSRTRVRLHKCPHVFTPGTPAVG